MKRVLLLLALVLALVAVPVMGAEDGFDVRRVIAGNEGVYFEGDIVREGRNTVFYLGFPGLGVGMRHYWEADQYVLARVGFAENGLALGLHLGKEFDTGVYTLDGRVGFRFDAVNGPKFTAGLGLLF